MKKYKSIGIWLGVFLYLVVTLGFVGRHRSRLICTTIDVVIKDTTKNKFVNKNDVILFLKKEKPQYIGEPLDSIDISHIEDVLKAYPVIKQAEIYKTLEGELMLEVEQRTPIMRVFDKDNNSCYMDIEGEVMPLSDKYTARVAIASGNIDALPLIEKSKITEIDKNDTTLAFDPIIVDIYKLGKHIYEDSFWRSQFEQIYITPEKEFELIPKVGAHIIKLGTIKDYEWKLKKLKAVYEKGFQIKGWNTYKTINLKYGDQVVCTKR